MDVKKVVGKAFNALQEIDEKDVPAGIAERFREVRLNLAVLWLVLDKQQQSCEKS